MAQSTAQTTTLTLERMTYGPSALAHDKDGKTVFVLGGVAGDTVEVQITSQHKNYSNAQIINIVAQGPHHIKPVCTEVELLSGCPWANIDYTHQLVAKREHVTNALVRIAHFNPSRVETLVAPCQQASDPWHYRNKLELNVEKTGERVQIGVRNIATNQLMPLQRTDLLPSPLAKLPKAIAGALSYLSNSRDLSLLRVGIRASRRTKDLELALWCEPGAFPRSQVTRILNDAIQGQAKLTSIVRVLTKGPQKARKTVGVERLFGKGAWSEQLLYSACGGRSTGVGVDAAGAGAGVGGGACAGAGAGSDTNTHATCMTFSAPSFFQVNTKGAEKLVELVMEFLQPLNNDIAMDLYSGAGTFTLPLARLCKRVYAVESSGSSVRDLRRNLDACNLHNVQVTGGDAGREFPDTHANIIVVDPPRAGLAPNVIDQLCEQPARAIAYVSCDPATLARDLSRFEEKGIYKVQRIVPVDLFPQTFHVETVAVLSRKSVSKSFIPVSISPKDMGLSEEKAQPTYANIRDYVQKTHGMKVSSLYVAQMKAECGLETQADRSGDRKQPKCPPEKREAILDAFRHFGMID